jgi:hypothetical protein
MLNLSSLAISKLNVLVKYTTYFINAIIRLITEVILLPSMNNFYFIYNLVILSGVLESIAKRNKVLIGRN